MIKEKLMVSAIILTYKHEKYIKKAIESILIQDTDFEYELIIADDCSPDNTKKIVTDIIEKHPKAYRIKYFTQKKNIGMLANGNFSLNKAEGKYIAFCEGDDYWIDSLKLKKQVNFLEENPGFSCCAHNSIIKYENATNSNLQQTMLSTQQSYHQAQSNLEYGPPSYHTAKSNYEIARTDYESAQDTYDTKSNDYAIAKSNYDEARDEYGETTFPIPYDEWDGWSRFVDSNPVTKVLTGVVDHTDNRDSYKLFTATGGHNIDSHSNLKCIRQAGSRT